MKIFYFFCALLVSTTSFSQVPNYVPTNGLCHFYNFNGNYNDQITAVNGIAMNGATLSIDRFGNASSALLLDGINDYINLSNTFFNGAVLNSLTYSVWINLPTLPTTTMSISSKESYWKDIYLNVNGDGSLSFNGTASSTSFGISSPTNIITANQWHHIVITLEPFFTMGILKMYVNNQLVVSNGLLDGGVLEYAFQNGGMVPANNHIGAVYAGNYFNGSIDDFGLWNRTLTTCEIAALYSSHIFSSNQTIEAIDTYTWPVNNQTYTQSGTYTAVIPNAAGCDSTIVLNLSMEYTGIDSSSPSFFNCFPNPTADNLYIEGNWIENRSFELIDFTGKVIRTGVCTGPNYTLDLLNIEFGQYILKMGGEHIKVVKN